MDLQAELERGKEALAEAEDDEAKAKILGRMSLALSACAGRRMGRAVPKAAPSADPKTPSGR